MAVFANLQRRFPGATEAQIEQALDQNQHHGGHASLALEQLFGSEPVDSPGSNVTPSPQRQIRVAMKAGLTTSNKSVRFKGRCPLFTARESVTNRPLLGSQTRSA